MQKRHTGRVVCPGCDRYIKSTMWFVSRSSLEATASKPAHPRRSNPPQAAVPICLPSPPPLPLTRLQPVVISLQSALYMCVYETETEKKGQKKKKTVEQHYRFTAGPSFPVPVPLDGAAVAASLLTGCWSWHDMFPQQTAAPSFPPWIKSNQWADAVWLELWYCLIAQRLSLTHTVVSITAWFTAKSPRM